MEISVNETLTWKDLIAIYAAVVATGVALMNFLKYRREIKNKLAVTFCTMAIVDVDEGKLSKGRSVTAISVVNHSTSTKYFTHPFFQIKGSTGLFTPVNEEDTFPVKLESGQSWNLNIEQTIKGLKKSDYSNELRVFVTDTLGKKFSSKWVRISELK